MKKIGIDARLYFQTGVGVYIRNLLHNLEKLTHAEITFYIYVMKEDSPRIYFDNPLFIKKEVTARWHSFAEQATFLRILNKDNLDLMHFTYFSYPVRYKKPFIATVHDVTPLLFKTGKASTKNRMWYEIKHRAFKYVLKNQVKKATRIITPTQTVKNQLKDIFGVSMTDKIHPLYEGVDHELMQTEENHALKALFSDEPFIYIGNFYPHKNVDRLVEAFAQSTIEKRLVLIGPHNLFAKRLQSKIQQLGQSERIILYQNAPATIQDLVFFYKHAAALINPSLSEGFGLPLIEAVHFNLPVIASNIEVFKELLNDHYTAFDPQSIESIQQAIEQFSSQNKTFNYVGIKERFSFELMSEKTLALYQEVLSA